MLFCLGHVRQRTPTPLSDRLLRLLRPAATGVVRCLQRYAPDAFASLLTEVRTAGAHGWAPAVFSLTYGDTTFKLYVAAGHPTARETYRLWSEGTQIEEVVMLECLTRLVQRVARPEFVDIGSFMGHYACYVATLAGAGCRTYAVESNPRFGAAIRRSIELNDLGNLRVLQAVLSDTIETAGIRNEEVFFGESGQDASSTITGDELFGRENIRPKILKVDVHGAEGKVLRGLQRVLRESVDFLLLELHRGRMLRKYSGDVTQEQLLAFLEGLGYHLFHVAGQRYRGTPELQRQAREGLSYRPLDGATRAAALFDRNHDVFVLCSKTKDLEPFLGPSAVDPMFRA